jgi:hypothetical protein
MRGYWGLVIGPSLLGPQVLVLVKTLGAGQPHTSRSAHKTSRIHVLLGLDPLDVHVLRRGPIGGDLNVEGRIAPRGGIRWSIQTV